MPRLGRKISGWLQYSLTGRRAFLTMDASMMISAVIDAGLQGPLPMRGSLPGRNADNDGLRQRSDARPFEDILLFKD